MLFLPFLGDFGEDFEVLFHGVLPREIHPGSAYIDSNSLVQSLCYASSLRSPPMNCKYFEMITALKVPLWRSVI